MQPQCCFGPDSGCRQEADVGLTVMSLHSESQATASGQKFNTRQLAERYQVSSRTIQNWRDNKLIPFIRVNARLIRYDPDAVDRALRGQ